MIKILDNGLNRQAIFKEVIEPNRFEEINGENTLTFSAVLDEKASTYIDENSIIEIDGDYFDLVYFSKNQNEDGTLTIDVEAEHVSYRLNNYSLEYYTKIGTPTAILTELLVGTGFTVGTVELTDSVTYSAFEEMTKRQLIMEFVKNIGGEIDFDKFEVSILTHRGSTAPRILTTGKNVRIISKVYNKRETDELGNPLVAYTCEPIQPTGYPFMLGDEVLLIQKDLNIQETLRIVRLGYDPYNTMTAEIELANFISGVEDQMYRIATTTVAKEKIYNGCRIGPDEGFVAERSDGKAKTIMNATEGISIYSDIGSGLAKNFFVGLDGRIQAKGLDIDGSGTFSGTLSGADGTFSGTISASIITGSTITGSTVITGTNTKIKMSDYVGDGEIRFINALNTEVAELLYDADLNELILRDLNNMAQVTISGSQGLSLLGNGSDIEVYSAGINLIPKSGTTAKYNGNEIATKDWVSEYFSPIEHGHTADINAAIAAHVTAYHS